MDEFGRFLVLSHRKTSLLRHAYGSHVSVGLSFMRSGETINLVKTKTGTFTGFCQHSRII